MGKDLFGGEPIRALSWKEPFATMMLHGKIETRKWPTDYRGLVLICASKTPYSRKQMASIIGWDFSIQSHINAITNQDFSNTLGKAIAVGNLVDCRPMKRDDEEKCFVKFYPDLFCHIYKPIRPIKPFPYKGQQGWKKLKDDIISQIKYIGN